MRAILDARLAYARDNLFHGYVDGHEVHHEPEIESQEHAGRNAPYRWARRNRSTSASRTSCLRSPG